MLIKVVDVKLVDINPAMVRAWRHAFEKNAEVDVVHGSMLDQRVDAWVSPTNSAGSMDGGLDLAVKRRLGDGIERRIKGEIARRFGGSMPVGYATCVETGRGLPGYLISTPTMRSSSEDVSETLNVALACAAAFHVVDEVNAERPGSIRSIALPGLGASTGRVPVKTCAFLMWLAYSLLSFRRFSDFDELRAALEGELWRRTERPGAA
jgi:O-acetyl-ADP-ribose deacetylase (regulator of RNase III)